MKLNNIRLFHSFMNKDGSIISGMTGMPTQNHLSSFIPQDLKGLSVLDIGTFDGYYSFLCESRGASRVVAIDSEEHDLAFDRMGVHHDSGCAGFMAIKELLYPDSKVIYHTMNVYDVGQLNEKFDIVLFMGVYYHTKHPLLAFEKCHSVTKGTILVEGLVNPKQDMSMDFIEGAEMNGDPTNWWNPSFPCLLAMMRVAGFKNIEVLVPAGRVVVRAHGH